MEPQPPTALDITTLIVAICAAVVAATALGWQIASWLMSGVRAEVEVSKGGKSKYSGEYTTVEPSTPRETFSYPIPLVVVDIRNTGRLPVSVIGWSFRLPGGVKQGDLIEVMGPKLPHRLDVAENARWGVELNKRLKVDLLIAQREVKVADVKVHVVVSLGNGKRITTRKPIVFTADELEQGE